MDREEEWKVLNNGNDFVRKCDEKAQKKREDAKEERHKVDRTNDDTIKKHLRNDKFQMILNHRNGSQQEDAFVDLLI